MRLTEKEVRILNAMRDNEYGDAMEFPTWTFTAVENANLEEKVARGVLSSLIKKGLIIVSGRYGTQGHDDESTIGFTDKGKELFKNATGEISPWYRSNENDEYAKLLPIGEQEIIEREEVELIQVLDTMTNLEEVKPERTHHGKEVEVYKDGQLIKTLNSLTDTFKWATENQICNIGWVKESLHKGIETKAGRKYKVGGYKFQYK